MSQKDTFVNKFFLFDLGVLQMMAQKGIQGASSLNGVIQNTASGIAPGEARANDCPNLEFAITNLLQMMRIPAHIKGYHYLRKAILLEVESEEVGSTSAKVLFPKVAKHFGATPDKVDRGIRYALSTAWRLCDLTTLQTSHSFTFRFSYDKPTNLEFIACVADYYKLQSGN